VILQGLGDRVINVHLPGQKIGGEAQEEKKITQITFHPSGNLPQNVEQNNHDEHKHWPQCLWPQDSGAPNSLG
jgi:predicted Abi (CAAX) family protease